MLSELMKQYRRIVGKESVPESLLIRDCSSKSPNTLRRGFYSLDGFDIYPAKEVGIIVHPFFIFTDDILANPNSYAKSYLENFYGFLDAFEGPVLTLEEGNRIKKTMDKYRKTNRTFNRFFVKTEDCNPDPTEIKWNDITNFVKAFKPKKLKAAGGYYNYYPHSNDYTGCLGFTINTLKEDFKDIEIVEGCTF
jgi:hypothetical protein